jgi:hypothetical protein
MSDPKILSRRQLLVNLIMAGEVVGLWAAIAIVAVFDLSTAVFSSAVATVVAGVLIVLDVRKAWREYDRDHYSG